MNTKPHFQSFNALKSTSFQAFQIISDFFRLFLKDTLTPLKVLSEKEKKNLPEICLHLVLFLPKYQVFIIFRGLAASYACDCPLQFLNLTHPLSSSPFSQDYESKLKALQKQMETQSLLSGSTSGDLSCEDDDDDGLESKLLTILFLAVLFWYIYYFSMLIISLLFVVSCYLVLMTELRWQKGKGRGRGWGSGEEGRGQVNGGKGRG